MVVHGSSLPKGHDHRGIVKETRSPPKDTGLCKRRKENNLSLEVRTVENQKVSPFAHITAFTRSLLDKPSQERKACIDRSPPKVREYVVPEPVQTPPDTDHNQEDRSWLSKGTKGLNQFPETPFERFETSFHC